MKYLKVLAGLRTKCGPKSAVPNDLRGSHSTALFSWFSTWLKIGPPWLALAIRRQLEIWPKLLESSLAKRLQHRSPGSFAENKISSKYMNRVVELGTNFQV